jgi:hypothetical protein
MKRRSFLLASGAAVTAGGAALLWRRFGPTDNASDDAVIAALWEQFGYLKLEPTTPAQFVADYRRVVREPIAVPLDDEVSCAFLLSTDFIQNGADEAKPVRYVTLYSPYDNPCYNPFTLHAWQREGEATL